MYCVPLLVGRVIPQSAHSAYDKAAQYFQIKLRRAPVAADFRADVKAMKRLINKNTIMVPLFPFVDLHICVHICLLISGM